MSPRSDRSASLAPRACSRFFARALLCARGTAPRFELAVVLLVLLQRPAWAIPSPDVMVNLFASATQVLGVASLILGRWFLRRRAPGSTASRGGASRVAFLAACGLCAVTSVGWYLYYAQVRDRELARLQANLTRESNENGRKILDVSLKELSFSDQLERPDGVATEELARWIEAGEPLQIFDIRESEEVEVGAISGVRAVRFPDLWADPERYVDRESDVLLLCFNGNRSSQLAEELAALGYRTRFLVGGYEKWLAEDRPLAMNAGYARKSLREIPDYPNRDVLIDSPEAAELVEERGALFVDVRYPADFEASPLPGAVNVPMRKLTTLELEAALRALPKRPIIVPCYDRRSSFFGLVIGLRLHRLGYEYLGRYTTPESYAPTRQDKPHVAAWKAAHAPESLLSLASAPFEGVLRWLEGRLGSLALAIAALVLVLRGLIAPLSVLAERDRRVQARLAPRLKELQAHYRDDPAGRAQAAARILRAAGVRPALDLLATVLQLGTFTLFFSVVQRAAQGSTELVPGGGALGEPDATRVLPVAVAVLCGALIVVVTPRRQARWLAPLAAAALGALVWELAVAANLYLALSLVLVLGQNVGVGAWLARSRTRALRRERAARARYGDALVVPLVEAHRVPGCGNKAARLARLIDAGLPVPRGFVVRLGAPGHDGRGGFGAAGRFAIREAFRGLRCERVAVRSSGDNEDGADQSYAGVFESLLDVSQERLFEALEEVARSLTSARAGVYSGGACESGAILVQAMVPAEHAGVLFTEHPGESGAAAIEMVAGLGDALVSGRAQPRTLKLGRYSGRLLDGGPAPIEVEPLFRLGRSVEELFGCPQDIEWARAGGRYFLLQARDVTRLSRRPGDAQGLRERERARLLELARGAAPDEVVLAQTELTELLPEPTPYSLALMDSLWAHGGSTHRACAALGIPYEVAPDSAPLVVAAFGRLYVHRAEERRRLRRGPSSVAAFRLARAADEIERAWRDEFLPQHLREARLRDALDLGRFTLAELTSLLAERRADFVARSYTHAETINVAADFYLKAAMRALREAGLDPAEHLAHLPPTVVHRAMQLLARAGRDPGETRAFLELFGHRAAKDYELAEPRYSEAPELVREMAERSAGATVPAAGEAPDVPGRVLRLQVERARRYQALKEEAKHHALRDLAFLRRILLEIGARTGLGERVFQLLPGEVERLADGEFLLEASERAAARLEEREALAHVALGVEVRLADLESRDLEQGDLIPRRAAAAALNGTRVSGSGNVVGRARVLRTPDEIASFRRGEILVARFTDPTWTTVFPLARGIVTEVGGWLSHAAIQAREYGITAVVGAAGALDALATGDLVRVRIDGGVERLDERRRAPRTPVCLDVRWTREAEGGAGRLEDLSDSGALLVLPGPGLEPGQWVEIESDAGKRNARVARNGVPGKYGIQWGERALEAAPV
jgi:rhodanese-related sulfurtransferase/phosphohistidine swiveling domain-containing protein